MPSADRETAHSREQLEEAAERESENRERERGIEGEKGGTLLMHSAAGSLFFSGPGQVGNKGSFPEDGRIFFFLFFNKLSPK